jgi:hypothetical protein
VDKQWEIEDLQVAIGLCESAQATIQSERFVLHNGEDGALYVEHVDEGCGEAVALTTNPLMARHFTKEDADKFNAILPGGHLRMIPLQAQLRVWHGQMAAQLKNLLD